MIKKLVAWLVFLVLALYGIVLALVYFFTPQLMFPAPKPSYCAGELVKKINAGSDIIAVRVNKNSSADNWIIYSHGNGEDLGQIDLLMQEYAARLNANVVSYDYPGYGASMGHASEDRLGEYADAVYDYTVKELGADPKRIYFVGYSLGSVPAAYLAAKHLDARGAVLIGGIAEGAKTYLPVNVIPWKILPNVENVQKIQIPLKVYDTMLQFYIVLLVGLFFLYLILRYFFSFRLDVKMLFTSFENGFYTLGTFSLLLFLFQVKTGSLYSNLPCLIGIFSAGAISGGVLSGRIENTRSLHLIAGILPVLIALCSLLSSRSALLALFTASVIVGICCGYAYFDFRKKSGNELFSVLIPPMTLFGASIGIFIVAGLALPAGGLIACVILLCLSRISRIING